MPVNNIITVTGNLKDISGVAVAGSLLVQLCNIGPTLPRFPGTSLLSKTGQVEVDADATTGAFSVPLYANDILTPAGTYYTFTVRDDNGDVVSIEAYQFLSSGAASLDLSSVTPYAV